MIRYGNSGYEPHDCKCSLCEKDFKVKKIEYFLHIEVLDEDLEICFECAKIDDIKEITFKLLEQAKFFKDKASCLEKAAWSGVQSLRDGETEVLDQGIQD